MKTLTVKTPSAKRVSLIEQTRVLNISQMGEVCAMFGWDEQRYCEHQFEQYELFLKRVLHGSQLQFFDKIRFSELMRGFWNNEWMQRNEEFIPVARYILFSGWEVDSDGNVDIVPPPDEAAEAGLYDNYCRLHNGKLLATDHGFISRFEHVLELIFR